MSGIQVVTSPKTIEIHFTTFLKQLKDFRQTASGKRSVIWLYLCDHEVDL